MSARGIRDTGGSDRGHSKGRLYFEARYHVHSKQIDVSPKVLIRVVQSRVITRPTTTRVLRSSEHHNDQSTI